MKYLNSKISNLKAWISKFIFLCTLTFIFSCIFSCGQISSISINDDSDNFDADSQSVNQKMDILWMIDGSVSMHQEIESVQRNILSFIEQYITTGYDFKIGVIRTAGWGQYLHNSEQSRMAAQKAFDHANEAHSDEMEGSSLTEEDFLAGFDETIEDNLSETVAGAIQYFVDIYGPKIEALKNQIAEIETECSSDPDCYDDSLVLNSLSDPEDLYRLNTSYSPDIDSPLGMRLRVLKGHQKTLEAHKEALDSIEALKAAYDPTASTSAFESALGNLGNALEKIKIDGTNGIQNHMLTGLNILHSGQSINTLEDDNDFTSLTGSPILGLDSITEADRQAVNVNFCDCRYIDFNFDGDFDDSFNTSSTQMMLETYEGHEIDFNGDGDSQDLSTTTHPADETVHNIDFNLDGDESDTDLVGISEFVESWTLNLNKDDIISSTPILISEILATIGQPRIYETECENPHGKTNVSVDFNQDGDFRNGAFPDIIFDWDETVPLDETFYGVDFNGDGDTADTEIYLDINNNDLPNEVGLVVSEESIPLPTCVIFDDPGNPIADTWIKRNPDSFLSKFSRNVDVYGLRAGSKHGGFLNPIRNHSFDDNVHFFHADEREFQSITSFIEYGDRSVEFSKELFEMYRTDDTNTASDDALHSFWKRFEDVNWEDSKASSFFRKGAFMAIIIVTDEVDGSRFQMDAQSDNGGLAKRNTVHPNLIDNYSDTCSSPVLDPCPEPDPTYITSSEFLSSIKNFIKTKECQNSNLAEEEQCQENFSDQGIEDLYSIYTVTKITDSERFNALRDVAEQSGGFSLDINKDFGQQLKRISTNIIEATSVYMLQRQAQEGTLRVSWTWTPDEENTFLVPNSIPKGFKYTPSQPGEEVSHLQVTIPEVNYDESGGSAADGFTYSYEGNYIRIQGATYLPFQGAKLNINYTPRSLGDAN